MIPEIFVKINMWAVFCIYWLIVAVGFLTIFLWLCDKLIVKLGLTKDMLHVAARYYKERRKK